MSTSHADVRVVPLKGGRKTPRPTAKITTVKRRRVLAELEEQAARLEVASLKPAALSVDPTRTGKLRQAMLAHLNGRFAELAKRVEGLGEEDAWGTLLERPALQDLTVRNANPNHDARGRFSSGSGIKAGDVVTDLDRSHSDNMSFKEAVRSGDVQDGVNVVEPFVFDVKDGKAEIQRHLDARYDGKINGYVIHDRELPPENIEDRTYVHTTSSDVGGIDALKPGKSRGHWGENEYDAIYLTQKGAEADGTTYGGFTWGSNVFVGKLKPGTKIAKSRAEVREIWSRHKEMSAQQALEAEGYHGVARLDARGDVAELALFSNRLVANLFSQEDFPAVLQQHDWDCGPACLEAVCRWLGKRCPQVDASEEHGTQPHAMVEALEAAGIDARLRHFARPLDLNTPALCLIQHEEPARYRNGHWVVVTEVDHGVVRLMDPLRGFRWMTAAHFDERWHDRDSTGKDWIRCGIEVRRPDGVNNAAVTHLPLYDVSKPNGGWPLTLNEHDVSDEERDAEGKWISSHAKVPAVTYSGQPKGLEDVPDTERNELPLGHSFHSSSRAVASQYAGSAESEMSGRENYSLGRQGEVYHTHLDIKNPMDLDKCDEDEWAKHLLPDKDVAEEGYTTRELAEALGLEEEAERDEETGKKRVIGWLTPDGNPVDKNFDLEDVAKQLWRERSVSGDTLEFALRDAPSGQLSVMFPEAGERYARANGHDGYVFKDAEMGGTTVVPFESEQVTVVRRTLNASSQEIDTAAAEAHPSPTQAQREAGNYVKGHVSVQGLPVTIETAAGVKRKPWHDKPLAHHYGYVKRTLSAADGDHVDCFIGPDPDSDKVFVVDQVKGDGFDEHKCMVGFKDAASAKAAYLANYPDDWGGFGGMRELSVEDFKLWLEEGDTSKPIAEWLNMEDESRKLVEGLSEALETVRNAQDRDERGRFAAHAALSSLHQAADEAVMARDEDTISKARDAVEAGLREHVEGASKADLVDLAGRLGVVSKPATKAEAAYKIRLKVTEPLRAWESIQNCGGKGGTMGPCPEGKDFSRMAKLRNAVDFWKGKAGGALSAFVDRIPGGKFLRGQLSAKMGWLRKRYGEKTMQRIVAGATTLSWTLFIAGPLVGHPNYVPASALIGVGAVLAEAHLQAKKLMGKVEGLARNENTKHDERGRFAKSTGTKSAVDKVNVGGYVVRVARNPSKAELKTWLEHLSKGGTLRGIIKKGVAYVWEGENDFVTIYHDDVGGALLGDRSTPFNRRFNVELRDGDPVLVAHNGVMESHEIAAWAKKAKLIANTRFAFHSSPEKVKAFQRWLQLQMAQLLLSQDEDELWRRYIEQGYKKGAGRAFDDTNAASIGQRGAVHDFYKGTREQFLRSSFAQPVSVERVKVLAARTFDEMKNVTHDMATKMGRTLVDGLIAGKHSKEVAKDLQREVGLGKVRAELVAHAEIIRAHAHGQLDSYKAQGMDRVGVQVEFTGTADNVMCPECAALVGQVYDIDEAYGVIPVHPRCRCAWRPAIGKALSKLRGVANRRFYPWPVRNEGNRGRSVIDEARDPATGRWTSTGGETLHAATHKGKEEGWHSLGKAVPEHVRKLAIPPAWTHVFVNHDPEGDLLARGKDSKGREQKRYSKAHEQRQALAKFLRVRAYLTHRDEMLAEMDRDVKERPELRDTAEALRVVMQTGARPGSDKDTKATFKSYGVTTLEGHHVLEGGHLLRFVAGKHGGKDVEFRVDDPKTAAMLLARSKEAGADGKLFPGTSAVKLQQYSKTKDGGGLKPKDARTAIGTETATREVAKVEAPKTVKEYKAAVMAVAATVSKRLGNTPAIALKSYIDPTVFRKWKEAAGA